jgi:DNA-binding CsgD family transcriptional regulator
MRKAALRAAVSSEGFILLDSSMAPIFVDHAAAEVLLYPQEVESQKKLNDSLASKIRFTLLSAGSVYEPVLVTRFRSGKRLYRCRAFRVNPSAPGKLQPSIAVLLERGSERSISLEAVSERYRLTAREREVLYHLVGSGLTTKEIAARMGISSNTVKTFLRLMMFKMGVSTRSGIVGKAMITRLELSGARGLIVPESPSYGPTQTREG